MKHLVNKLVTEKVPFMGEEVEVKKMSVNEVFEIQKLVQKSNKSKAESAQIDLLIDVIRIAVVGAQEVTTEEFKTFPISEMTDLSNHIMRLAGLTGGEVGN